jgi:hypothetical protein
VQPAGAAERVSPREAVPSEVVPSEAVPSEAVPGEAVPGELVPIEVVPEPRALSPWPELAALVPGVILHGSGTWLQGRTETSKRLLLAEGSGLLATFLSAAVLFRTGAARNLVGTTALVAVAGVSTFGLSLLSSLYATWAPREGWGEAQPRRALLESSLGYSYVADPQFAFHHFLTTRLDALLGAGPALHLALATAHAPDQGNQLYQLGSGLRLLEQRPSAARTPDGSYLEPRLGFGVHRFDSSGFVTRVLELELQARLDSERLLPDVRGAFFQLGAGWAEQWFAFDVPGVRALNASSLLLAHAGFGVYVRRCAELELYYDHRHDGFAGGLTANGLGSGVAGHFGLRGRARVSPSWGLEAEAQIGSAWVLGLAAVLSVGERATARLPGEAQP